MDISYVQGFTGQRNIPLCNHSLTSSEFAGLIYALMMWEGSSLLGVFASEPNLEAIPVAPTTPGTPQGGYFRCTARRSSSLGPAALSSFPPMLSKLPLSEIDPLRMPADELPQSSCPQDNRCHTKCPTPSQILPSLHPSMQDPGDSHFAASPQEPRNQAIKSAQSTKWAPICCSGRKIVWS